MRALHLLGLRGPGLTKLRYEAPTYEPLILPSWLPPADREVLLAFYQQVLGDLLPRIEVDWGQSLVPSDASYLRHARLHHGAVQDLIVVRVRTAGVDLHEVVAVPEIAAFQHVAIACDHPALNETVGRLRELTQLVGATAQGLYEELADELSLRADGVSLLEPLVHTLLNPIPVLEAYNALIRVQGELRMTEAHRDAVYLSVLGRLLDDLPGDELVGLSALVLRGSAGFAEALGARSSEVEVSLRARMVILDGRLIRWARFLAEPSLRDLVEGRIRRLAAPPPSIDGLATVQGWLPEGRPAPSAGDPIRDDVIAAAWWINEGKLGRAAETLASLEPRLEEPRVTDETRGDFWNVVGRLRVAERRWSEAEPAFRWSLAFLKSADARPERRSMTMSELARGLGDNGRWPEAEPLFRKVLELKEEGGDTPTSRGITMHELARGLRDNGGWPEAEPLFRKALELKEEGGDTPTSRGITMHELARGLLDNGRWTEAEPLFREALRLAEEGGDTPTSRGTTMDELARGLRDNGRWAEAEPLFRKVLELMEEGGDTPTSRGITMDELARGLRDNGRWPEAEPLFRKALELKEEGGDTPTSRGITMDALARGLRDNGRWPEAEPLFRKALELKEEGGDTTTSRSYTMDALARGLRDNVRWPEAEPLFRKALELMEEGGDTTTSRSYTMDALARGLRDNVRWPEAEPLFRKALELMEEGGDTPTSRGITTDHLARGLRDNVRWAEAEPLFRRALQLKAEGGETPVGRSVTMFELVRGLRDNGRGAEAESLLRDALQLKEEGIDTPIGRAHLRAYATILRTAGRGDEARLLEEELAKLESQK